MNILNLILFFIFVFIQPAYAYIDPGILSFIWQGLILALTSTYFLFKNVRDKVFEFFLKVKNKFKNEKTDKSK